MESKGLGLRHQVSPSLWGRALLAPDKAKVAERASVGLVPAVPRGKG